MDMQNRRRIPLLKYNMAYSSTRVQRYYFASLYCSSVGLCMAFNVQYVLRVAVIALSLTKIRWRAVHSLWQQRINTLWKTSAREDWRWIVGTTTYVLAHKKCVFREKKIKESTYTMRLKATQHLKCDFSVAPPGSRQFRPQSLSRNYIPSDS